MPLTRTARNVSLAFALAVAFTTTIRGQDAGGWIDLLAGAGPELKGWTRGPIPPGGTLNPESQWSLDAATGHLVCEGDGGHEWLRWDTELSDFIFRGEFRYTPVEGKKKYNSGMYARNSADATIWHQAQFGDGNGGFLFGETMVGGERKFFSLAKEVRDAPVRPAGEWNTVEIRCQGQDMILAINGEMTCALHDCEVPSGHVGVEAEGYRIEFRNLKVRRLMPAKAQPEAKAAGPLKVVVHINYDDADRQGHVLKNLVNVLKDAPDTAVEVVCHGAGIGMVVAAGTGQAEAVASLVKQGVRFVACENTMRQRMIARGDLLPDVGTVPSGTLELIRKQQREGYAYLRP
jgi:intracellular sulfur oxidation DsrE/DsrF family protein